MPSPEPVEDDRASPPNFDAAFRRRLEELFRWRRDVRRFRRDPVDAAEVAAVLRLAALAPSVGFSQPWRFVKVDDPTRRAAIQENFRRANRAALADQHGERARLYAQLKLAGLEEAPVHLAVFCDETTEAGHGLGRKTMPESLRYSVVTAVHTLWLAARARGLGVGWVSILDPEEVSRTLEPPGDWALVAYLCIGYPEEEHTDPELERSGWEERRDVADCIVQR
jgi:5,6-dimethylbenzimidazole synthase